MSNLTDKEFKIMIIKMLKKHKRRIKTVRILTKLENIKKNQIKLKNTINEVKNILEGNNSRLDDRGEWISELEDRIAKITQAKDKKDKRIFLNKDNLKDFRDNIKYTNIHIIGVPEGEERGKGPEKIFEEIIVEKFSNMGREIAIQVQEAQRVPGRINPRRNTARYIVIKWTKIKTKKNY